MSNEELISKLLHIRRILNDGRIEDPESRLQADGLVTDLLISLDSKFIA